jgi:hypothetical protein
MPGSGKKGDQNTMTSPESEPGPPEDLTLETLADAEDLWDAYYHGNDDPPVFMTALGKQKVRAVAALAAARTGRSLAEVMKLPPDELNVLAGALNPNPVGGEHGGKPVSSRATGS